MEILRQEPVVSDVIDAYVDWREACVAVNDAYAAWTGCSASGPGGAAAFRRYMLELDQEQRTAEVYASAVSRAGQGSQGDDVSWLTQRRLSDASDLNADHPRPRTRRRWPPVDGLFG